MPKIPTDHGNFLLGHIPELQKNVLKLLQNVHHRHGDITRIRFGTIYAYLFVHPNDLEHIFQVKNNNINKDTRGHRIIKTILGEGLLMSEGSLWRRQRKSGQETINQKKVQDMIPAIVNATNTIIEKWDRWKDNNVNQQMSLMAAMIFDKSCFGLGMSEEKILYFIKAQNDSSIFLSGRSRRMWSMPLWISTKENKKFLKIKKEIRQIAKGIIDNHRKTYYQERTLLARIMKDNETGKESFNEEQICEEIYSYFSAGNETVGVTLQWFWYLVTRYPDVQQRLVAEIDQILGSHLPTAEKLNQMEYLDAVVKEVLRLYPALWQMVRSTINEDCIGGFKIPAKSVIIICPYLTHRHTQFWDQPEEFQPERFIQKPEKERHLFSYLPFGRGPHQCVGYHLAMIEMKCMVAMLLQKFTAKCTLKEPVQLKAIYTLLAKDPIHIQWQKRIY